MADTIAGKNQGGVVEISGAKQISVSILDNLHDESREWNILVSGERALTDAERVTLALKIQEVAARYGIAINPAVFYADRGLEPGMSNPGDPEKGIYGPTIGVNLVGPGGQVATAGQIITTVIHEIGHQIYGPGVTLPMSVRT